VDEILSDARLVFHAALQAVVLGDASHFRDFFADDVTFASPHLTVTSRSSLQAAVGEPESSLHDIAIEVSSLDAIGDKVVAEWRLEATFSEPLLFDDDLLIEPTGDRVHVHGASVAEFRCGHITSFRHYFDDSEFLDQIPGVPAHLRWTAANRGPCRSSGMS
jgi:ketosteroid isomerase-like protein